MRPAVATVAAPGPTTVCQTRLADAILARALAIMVFMIGNGIQAYHTACAHFAMGSI